MKKLLLILIISVSISVTAQTIPSYVPTNGLVGWWPFNGNANDESGNGNNGTIINGSQGNIQFSTNRLGENNNAVFYNNTPTWNSDGAYIKLPTLSNFNYSNDFTFIFWAKPTSNSTSEIINQGRDNDGAFISRFSGGYYQYRSNNVGLDKLDNSVYNNWSCYFIIKRGNKLYRYKNTTIIDSSIFSTPINLSSNIWIGKHNEQGNGNGSNYCFVGYLDDIAIYNRALTQQEVTNLYNAQNIPSNVPTNGLVGWWPFNGNANDESGNGNNGTVNGATLTTDRNGNANKAYSFDGVNDYILTNSFSINVNSTFSFWVKANSTLDLSATSTQANSGATILSKGASNSPCNYSDIAFGFKKGNEGNGEQNCNNQQWLETELGVGCNLNYVSNCNSNIQLNNSWQQITIVIRPNHIIRYMNGVLIDSINHSLNSLSNSGFPFSIGARYVANMPGLVQGFWKGEIDDIAIYNRALTQQEVTNLYNAQTIPSYVPTNGLVGYWPFNGNANDESGNGNNGTVNGATLTTDRNGNPNSAYYFDYLNEITTNFSEISGTQARTFSFWMKNQNGNRTISPIWYGGSSSQAIQGAAFNILFNRNEQHDQCNCWPTTFQGVGVGADWIYVLKSTTVGDNNWHNWTIVQENIGNNFSQLKYYKDGELINSNTIFDYNGNSSTTINTINQNKLKFGKSWATPNVQSSFLDRAPTEYLDDIAIYNRALTQAEITALYNSNSTNTYTITSSSGANGSITPSGSVTVNAGSSKRFLFTPTSGYKVDSVNVNGVKVDSLVGYTFDNVSANNTIKVTFKAKPINLTATKTTVCSNNTNTTLTVNSNFSNNTLGNMPTNGLVGYWPFNGNANDESGNGNNGTVNGATLTTDRFGNSISAYNFNGNQQYIVTNSIQSQLSSKTFSAWVKLNSLNQTGGGVISIQKPNGSEFDALVYNEFSSGWFFGSDYLSRSSTSNFIESQSNEWINMVVSYENNNFKMYRNGILIHTSSQYALKTFSLDCVFLFGFRHYWAANGFINAKLDDIFIYNRALSDTEIQQLYNLPNPNTTNTQASILWSTGDTTQTISVTPAQTTKYYCTVTCNGTSYTDSITINVDATAVAGSITGSGLCTPNTGTTLTLNNSTGTIKWQKSTNYTATTPTWTTITGATATTYATGTLTTSTAYRAILTSATCGDTTDKYVVVVSPKPVAGAAALYGTTSALVCSGSSKSLNLTGSTGSIQWQTASTSAGPWTDIEGATTATYTFENLTTTGLYRAKVSSGACTEVYSNAITLTVKQPTSAGTITASSTAVCNGSGATLTLSGSSGTILWQKSTNYSATTPTWATATGTSATLSTGALTASTAYRAVLSNSPCPSSTATMVTVTVSPKAVAGVSAVNNTSGLTVCKGGDKPIKLTGSSGSLQWQASTSSATTGFTDVSGATTQPYTFTNIQSNTWYRAKLSSGVCPTVYSNVLAITAKTPTTAGTITTTSGNLCAGTTGKTLTLSGSSGTIAWQKSTNWTATTPTWAVATGTTTTFTTGALTASTAYRAVLTNAPCPSSTADYIVVNVDPKVVVKTITANVTSPTGATATTAICASTEKILTLGAGYVGSIQWQRATTATGPWTDIDGATSSTYTVSNPSVGANYFRVKLSSGVCAVGYTTAVAVYYKACSSAIPTYIPTNGLVAYWPFNGNANDESGNNNHGTVNGATLTSDRNGIANKAYSFNGLNYIGINYSSYFNFNTNLNFSISAWIKINAFNDYFRSFFSYACADGGGAGGFQLFVESQNGNPLWYEGGATFNQTSGTVFDNNWHHTVTIFNRVKDSMYVYLDNSLIGISSINPNYSYTPTCLPELRIGGERNGQTIHFFKGKLDEYAIYNRALTQSEITALYIGTTTSGMAQLDNNSLSETTKSLNNTILNNTDAVQQKSNEQIETTPFDAIMYPNPYENYFNVQLTSSSDEQVAIKVYDMLGKVVEEHTVYPSEMEALQLGKDLSNGEYSIVIMQAGDVLRKRLVRQAH